MTHSIGLSAALVDYINAHNSPEHPVMTKCRVETAIRYPDDEWFQISQEQASFMAMMIRMIGAHRILEVGTFNGYSAMAFAIAANANSGGLAEVFTLDNQSEWCGNARSYFEQANLTNNITLIEGEATLTLPDIIRDKEGYFDFCFIDADKKNTNFYVELCLKATRSGGIILVDNILWDGKVLSPETDDPDTVGLKNCAIRYSTENGYTTMMCSVGDGILFIQKA